MQINMFKNTTKVNSYKRCCILKTRSAYKGIFLFIEDIDGPVQVDTLYIQLISNPSPTPAQTPQSQWHIYPSVLEKWSWSHAHLLLPHDSNRQTSPCISTKRTQEWLDDEIVFFSFLLHSCPESQEHKSLLPPHRCKRHCRRFSRRHSFILIWECWKKVEDTPKARRLQEPRTLTT